VTVATTPDPELPQSLFTDTRIISSCSRYQASTFGSPAFAGLMNNWDSQATQKQELLIAYLMGLAVLLEAKGVFTQAEFAESIQEWLNSRKLWAQDIANEVIAAWNADNLGQAQPLLNVADPSFRNAEPPAEFPFWPWQYGTPPGSP
jgi:hypothetical protein